MVFLKPHSESCLSGDLDVFFAASFSSSRLFLNNQAVLSDAYTSRIGSVEVELLGAVGADVDGV